MQPQKRLNEILKMRNQSGSAMTEFAILTVVMVPLFFVMPTLGKITDINNTSIQASRYMAWERTVSNQQQKTYDELGAELHNRFLVHPEMGVRTGQGKITGDDAINPLWRSFKSDATDQGGRLVNIDGQKKLPYREESASLGEEEKLYQGIEQTGNLLSGVISDAKWGLESSGLYVGRVGVAVENAGLFSRGGKDCGGAESQQTFVCVERHNAILVDGWSAFSRTQVEQRTKAFVPGGILKPVGEMLSVTGAIPLMREMKGLEKSFGHVDVDVLPLDRYKVK
jgi:hypothetical protein